MKIRNLLIAACVLLRATAAHAQDQATKTGAASQTSATGGDAAVADAGVAGTGVADIVVTAQKRTESIQKVPISITALTSAALQQRGITGLSNFLSSPVAGLQASPQGGDFALLLIEIRGVSSIDAGQGTLEPGSAVYIDDVYLGRAQGLGSELVDPERIEVLRGPQGTLFGRNAEGGAIRIVTKKPTGVFDGNAKATIGNYGERRYEAHLDLPEFANFAVKLDYLNARTDGFTRNGGARLARLDHQRNFGATNGEGYRASVRWKPIADLTVDYAYDHVKTGVSPDYYFLSRPSDPTFNLPQNLPAVFLRGRPNDLIHTRVDQTWIPYYQDQRLTTTESHTLTLDYQLGNSAHLRSITGYRKLSFGGATNLADGFSFVKFGVGVPVGNLVPGAGSTTLGLPADLLTYGANGVVSVSVVHQRQWSEELQLVGDVGEFKYVLGAYYFNERATDARSTFFSMLYSDTSYLNPISTNPFVLPFPNQGANVQSAKSRSYAAFSQVTWTPAFTSDKLHITGGLRYTNDRKDFDRYLCGGSPCSIIPDPFKASRVDPAVTLAYDINPLVNVYAKYAQAYRAGGVSVRSAKFAPFGAETNKSFEIGLKSDLLDRHLRLNAAAYSSKLKNVQTAIQTMPGGNPTVTDITNIPGYTLKGVEVEMTAAPVDWLTFSASYTYQHAPYGFRVTGNAASYYVENYPEHAVTAAMDVKLPSISESRILFHVDYSIASKAAGTPRVPDNVGYMWQTERNVGNARVTVEDIPVGPTKLRLSGYVSNFLDAAYPIYSATAAQGIYNPPRTYGIEVGARF